MSDTKELTELQINKIINETINLSIIVKLKDLDLIDEKEFSILKEKIKSFS